MAESHLQKILVVLMLVFFLGKPFLLDTFAEETLKPLSPPVPRLEGTSDAIEEIDRMASPIVVLYQHIPRRGREDVHGNFSKQ